MSTIAFLLGLLALGVAQICAGWALLGEYGRYFLADPRRGMTTEVFAVLGSLGGQGYMAAFLMVSGGLLVIVAGPAAVVVAVVLAVSP